MPTLIVRGGEKDYDHPKRTSLEVSSPDQGLPADRAAVARGRLGAGRKATAAGTGWLFDPWVDGAPRCSTSWRASPAGVATFAGQ